MTLREIAKKLKRAYKKDPHRYSARVADTVWGPLGHFKVFQQDADDDVWSIEGVLTDESNMRTYSDIKTTREKATEHAKVLAGIAPFGPEILPITNRRGLVAHSRSKA